MTVVHILVLGAQVTHMDEDRNEPQMRVLEADLDDATPEALGTLPDRLRDAGAHHVSVLPMTTKGSRPGHLVRAVVMAGDVEEVARSLARETGSLGVRALPARHAFVAETDRRVVVHEVGEDSYEVGVKVGWMDDEVYDVSAEHAEAATVAAAIEVTPREITERTEAALGPMDSGFVVHLVERSTWEDRESESTYRPGEHEDLIPCTTPARVADVATSVFGRDRDLCALVFDPRCLSTPIRYVPTVSGHQPRIVGPVQREAIVAVHDVPEGPDGFVQPSELSTHSSSSR